MTSIYLLVAMVAAYTNDLETLGNLLAFLLVTNVVINASPTKEEKSE